MSPAAANIDKDTPRMWDYSSTRPVPLIYSRNKYAIPELIKINRDYAHLVAACEAGNINERVVDNLYSPLEAGLVYLELIQLFLDRGWFQEDDDSKALKPWLYFIHRAMENEGTCIKALQGVYWWGLEVRTGRKRSRNSLQA